MTSSAIILTKSKVIHFGYTTSAYVDVDTARYFTELCKTTSSLDDVQCELENRLGSSTIVSPHHDPYPQFWLACLTRVDIQVFNCAPFPYDVMRSICDILVCGSRIFKFNLLYTMDNSVLDMVCNTFADNWVGVDWLSVRLSPSNNVNALLKVIRSKSSSLKCLTVHCHDGIQAAKIEYVLRNGSCLLHIDGYPTTWGVMSEFNKWTVNKRKALTLMQSKITRLGSRSCIRKLPTELVKMVVEFLPKLQ